MQLLQFDICESLMVECEGDEKCTSAVCFCVPPPWTSFSKLLCNMIK